MTGTTRPLFLAGLALATAVLAGCSGTEAAAGGNPAPTGRAAPPPAEPYTGYPDSIAVLGHSGATGEGSGGEPGVAVPENSWATGTNPDVGSVYLRILSRNDAIEGHAYNFAEGGADLVVINEQAEAAVAREPAPELVLVQAIDGDLACPADDADLQVFEDRLTELLTTLSEGLPGGRFFLTQQDSSAPSTDAAMLTQEERARLGGTGPCAIFDPDGRVVPAEVERLEAIIARYNDRLGTVCGRFDRCYSDPEVFRYPQNRDFLAPDLNHYSVAGLGHRAEVAWSALVRAGLVPPD